MKTKYLFMGLLVLSIFLISFIEAAYQGPCRYDDDCPTGYECTPNYFCVEKTVNPPPGGSHCRDYNGEEWCCFDSSLTPYIINDIFICLPDDLNPNEGCCVGGGCNSYDDYRFCYYPNVATCGDNKIVCCNPSSPIGFPEYGACCSQSFPVYNEKHGSCWRESWECIMDSDCDTNEECSLHKCEQKKINVYRLSNNQCSRLSILLSERTSNDYDTLYECEQNIIEEPDPDPQPQTYYRFENNQCTEISILPSQKTSNDYDTLYECEQNIIEEPDPSPQPTPNLTLIITISIIVVVVILLVLILMKLNRGAKKKK